MTQEQILEGNKVIAEFMGKKLPTDEYVIPIDGELNLCYWVDELRFHSSWDWLMPVVRKIVEYCINESDDAFMSDEYTSILETVSLAVIEDSFKVVVEFIKCYNNQST